jgi:hypothetical protein
MTEVRTNAKPWNGMWFAGIGSRETPEETCYTLMQIGQYLAGEGWGLRSGGAVRADRAFDLGFNEVGFSTKEIWLAWKGANDHPSGLHPEAYPFTPRELALAEELHPAWSKCGPEARLLHQRNGRIMAGILPDEGPIDPKKLVKFVVCWTKDGQTKGGTGQALRFAERAEIPVFNLGKLKTKEELQAMLLELDAFQKAKVLEANAERKQTD